MQCFRNWFYGSPDVLVDFIFEQGNLFITIKNTGTRPALNVQTTFNQPIKGLNGTKIISDLYLFKNIEYLAPQKEIRTFVDSASAYFERKEPLRITLNLQYGDERGKRFRKMIKHDLEIYREIVYLLPGLELQDKRFIGND